MTEEVKKEEGAATEEKKEVEVPEKFKALVSEIEKMSVLELSELVKVLEEKFGVSAAAPMMMAGAPVAGGEAGEAAEEKSEFDIELVAPGDAKINVIKVVREITGQGLKDAKDLVDAAPKVIKEKVAKAEAEELKKKLEDAGATVNLK
jgi:large subunit ribosomal protein L7/L12